MKKRTLVRRNPVARTLRQPQYRTQMVRQKTTYTRKGKNRHQLQNDGGHYWARDTSCRLNLQ